MPEPIIRDYDKKTHKKCIQCRAWRLRVALLDPETGTIIERAGFGKHDSSDGLQSICHVCKNENNNKSRQKNATARIRHHIGTRCRTQLGDLAPPNFLTDLEDHLGYRIRKLEKALRKDLKSREGGKRSLREALQEGYHIDHLYPLSRFAVVVNGQVDWDMFRKCWAIENLSAIPAAENLAKGAKVLEENLEHASDANDANDALDANDEPILDVPVQGSEEPQ